MMLYDALEVQGSQTHEHRLRVRRLGIHTQQEVLVFMRADCHVCRSEGLTAHSRVMLRSNGNSIIATLYQVESDLLNDEEAGLSEVAWERLGLSAGDTIRVSHPPPVESLAHVRRRIYGHRLDESGYRSVIKDIVAGHYSDVHLSSFLTACATLPMDDHETVALTRVMIDVGEQLTWPQSIILDKHSIGGLPGNRTTPIVVSIVAAYGLTIPKTSSRAITSPAGTADTMETLAPVNLDLAAIRKVVERESGCVVWGGSVRLSPADDIFIRVERALDIDSEGQLIASVLSKKIAAGATHVVLDVPVGPTAKVRTPTDAATLSRRLRDVGRQFGLTTKVVLSDGLQPVGRGIGPALEARDVLAVLKNSGEAPKDLRARACILAGTILELGGVSPAGEGNTHAALAIDDGRAWRKFQRICEAQGGMRTPPVADYQFPLMAKVDGLVKNIDNRRLSRLAKLAGAPGSKAAGVDLHVRLGDEIRVGDPICTLHAQSRGELDYALDYAGANPGMITLESA